MKRTKLTVFLISIIFLSGIHSFAQFAPPQQQPVAAPAAPAFYSKGTVNYTLSQSLYGLSYTRKDDSATIGKYCNRNIDLEGNYFFADHHGIGLRLNLEGYKETPESGGLETYSSNLFYLNYVYGRNIVDNIDLFFKARFGYGTSKHRWEPEMGDASEIKANLFRFGMEFGSPFEIAPNAFFTPYIGYGYGSDGYDHYSEKTSNFSLGFNVNMFVDRDANVCDAERDWDIPDDRYAKGRWVISSEFRGMVAFGGEKQVWDDEYNNAEYKSGLSNLDIRGTGYYYLMDHFAVGFGIGISGSSTKGKDSDYKLSNSRFYVSPRVMFNAPTEGVLSNLFVEAGAALGNARDYSLYEFDNGDIEDETKYGVTEFDIILGYNYFITERVSLTPYIGYFGSTYKDKDSGLKTKDSGLTYGFRWDLHLN